MDFVSNYLTGTTLSTSEGWFYARKINVAATQDWANYIQKTGVDRWIEQQLHPEWLVENYQYERERKALFPSTFIKPASGKTLDKNFWDTYQPTKRNHAYDVSVYVLQSALHRLWRSNKQLQGTMALFWADMLAVNISKSPDGYHDYIDLLFNGALGKYKELLYQVTCSQTMSYFLDNQTNTRYALNENMGREIMELHSWGVEKGYTQDDVVAVAKLLTGLKGNTKGYFTEARPDLHQFGPQTVAGRTFANGGSTAADMYKTLRELTDYLAGDPATAQRIARRLVKYFVGQDDPYEALVQNLAAIYIKSDTDIRPVLRALFHSAEFKESGGKTVRRPWSVFCSAMAGGRIALKGTNNLSDTATMHKPLYKMFMTLRYEAGGFPFDAPATNGYSLDANDWINSVSYSSLSQFNRFMNYISKWDGNSADSLGRWSEPINWVNRTGIVLGKTTKKDAAKIIFKYLTGYEANNEELVNAIALYATEQDPNVVMEAKPGNDVVTTKDQVNRMVEATMTAPHLLIS